MKLDLKKLKIGENSLKSKKDEKARQFHSVEEEKGLRELLKKHRKKKKITQEEIATFSNLSRLAVNEFELGKTDVRLSTFFKLIKAYGFEMELKE